MAYPVSPVDGQRYNNKKFNSLLNVWKDDSANSLQNVAFNTTANTPTGTTRLNCEGYLYATRVYNAVWNDLAEFMTRDGFSEAGDVLIQTKIGVKKSNTRADKTVVGVFSDTYGYVLGAENAENKCPIGLSGRVDVKVKEPLEIGDLLVSDIDGFASKATLEEEKRPGIIIGKVLEQKFDSNPSRIKILIMNR